MRLFVAVCFPESVKKALAGVQARLAADGLAGRYHAADDLHLTLAFIGECESSAQVERALRGVRFRPFPLETAGIGRFGGILWVGVRENQELARLAEAVRAALREAGIRFDEKPFVPHITIVRGMKGAPPKEFPVPGAQMRVDGVSLMVSERGNEGARYREIFRVRAGEP